MNKKILELRVQLDNIDKNILQLLEERMDIIHQVGCIKYKLNIPIEDIDREEKIINKLKNLSKAIFKIFPISCQPDSSPLKNSNILFEGLITLLF